MFTQSPSVNLNSGIPLDSQTLILSRKQAIVSSPDFSERRGWPGADFFPTMLNEIDTL